MIPWLVVATACSGVTVALGSIKYLQYLETMSFLEDFPTPVTTISAAMAKSDSWHAHRIIGGSVRSPKHLIVSAEISARIVSLPFQSGQLVPEGATMLALFGDDLRAQREALLAELELTTIQLRRNQTLKEQSLIALDELDVLHSRLKSLKAQILVLDARLSRMTVRAPFEGTLGVYTQQPGELMQAGEVLTIFVGTSPNRWIDFKVPQGLTKLENGDTVDIRDIEGQDIGKATVIAVSEALTGKTRAYDVRAQIRSEAIRHGELVQVIVSKSFAKESISVPSRSVRWDADGPHVFVVEKDSKNEAPLASVSDRRVEIIGERSGRMFVEGDLSPGDLVANKGAFKLSPGALVNIKNVASSK